MKNLILAILFYIARAIFSLRYSLEIEGLEKIKGRNKLLFLPNHTALLDPLILCVLLWPKFKIRPLVLEVFIRIPFARFCINLVNPIPIPDFETSINQFKIVQADRALQKVVEGLSQGDNILMYPSGKLKREGKEVLGGNSGVQTLLDRAPCCRIVLVRISGFWGSSFSRVQEGKTPDLGKSFFNGMKILLKNLVFFTPRRKIFIQFEEEPAGFPGGKNRRKLNCFLENWYNQYLDDERKVHEFEPLKLVSLSMWRRSFPEIFIKKEESKDKEQGTENAFWEGKEKIFQEIRKILKDPKRKISPKMNLMIDLGMDSFNVAELMVYLFRNFEMAEIDLAELDTVENVLKAASGKKKGGHLERISKTDAPKEEKRLDPNLDIGPNFPESFVKLSKQMKSLSAVSDKTSGELNYHEMLRAVVILAKAFQKFSERRVAIMLPASVGAIIAILAVQMAGKTPVMLNWTLGPRYLEQMLEISGAERILSSWKFFENLSYVDFGGVVDKIVFLEDIKKSISCVEKISGTLLSICPAFWISKKFKLKEILEEDPAVILFTSGSESSPKGVVLTHKNILSDMEGSFFYLSSSYCSQDRFLSILPVFHSFGFSTLFYFFFSRLKIFFSPDPTDCREVARCIHEWKISILINIPTFIANLLKTATKEQLQSLREVSLGGDKVSEELCQIFETSHPEIFLRQAYGVTECSPAITFQQKNAPKEGVGQLIHGIEVITINPETLEKLPIGSEGELCVSGPIVFKGYLGDVKASFLELDGKKWYRTGDVGHITANNSIVLTARLKRFAKIGGEMISLGAIEDAIIQKLRKQGKISSEAPHLAVCTDDLNGNISLTLFTTVPIQKEQINEILRQAGFGRLIKIHEVFGIEEIPVMGTGKTNYRGLQNLLVKKMTHC